MCVALRLLFFAFVTVDFLFVVGCLSLYGVRTCGRALFNVCCLLFVDVSCSLCCCLLLLCVVRCLLIGVRCWLFVVYRVL